MNKVKEWTNKCLCSLFNNDINIIFRAVFSSLYMCVFFLVRIYPSALFSVCAFFRVLFFPSVLFSHALIYICTFFRCAFFLCAFFQCAFFRSPIKDRRRTRIRLVRNVAPCSRPTTSVTDPLHECKKASPCTKALLLSGIRAWIK